jgi:transposase
MFPSDPSKPICRAADPQSKGKVENMVKHAKQNFLAGRYFKDVETLNQ